MIANEEPVVVVAVAIRAANEHTLKFKIKQNDDNSNKNTNKNDNKNDNNDERYGVLIVAWDGVIEMKRL